MTAKEAYDRHVNGRKGYPPFDLLPPHIKAEYQARAEDADLAYLKSHVLGMFKNTGATPPC
jgi:hypothetical protein